MKSAFGWGEDAMGKAVKEMLQHGQCGLDGFIWFLQFFIMTHGLNGMMFESKINVLLEELETQYIRIKEVFIMPLWFLPESGHSCRIQWNHFWQGALPKLPFQGPIIPVELSHSGIETGMVLEWTGMESGGMQLNRFIYFTIIFFIFISIIFAKCTMCSPHHGSIAITCININDNLISTHTNDDDNQSWLSRHRCVFFFFFFLSYFVYW